MSKRCWLGWFMVAAVSSAAGDLSAEVSADDEMPSGLICKSGPDLKLRVERAGVRLTYKLKAGKLSDRSKLAAGECGAWSTDQTLGKNIKPELRLVYPYGAKGVLGATVTRAGSAAIAVGPAGIDQAEAIPADERRRLEDFWAWFKGTGHTYVKISVTRSGGGLFPLGSLGEAGVTFE